MAENNIEVLKKVLYNLKNTDNTINVDVECSLVCNTDIIPGIQVFVVRNTMQVIESVGTATEIFKLYRKINDYKTFNDKHEAEVYMDDILVSNTYREMLAFAETHDAKVTIRLGNGTTDRETAE